MQVQPYLFFDGRCEEAIDFYKKALGAKVEMMMRFKDNPERPTDVHARQRRKDHACAASRIGDTAVMASDGTREGQAGFKGFSLSITPKTRPRPTRCSTRWPKAARCRCR